MDKLSTLDFNNGTWKPHALTCEQVLQSKAQLQGQVIFASLKEPALALRDQLFERYQLEKFLLTKLCKDSNGFAGCKSTYSDTGNPCRHSFWCRFVVKQTREKLQPKSSFVPRSASAPGSDESSAPIHSSKSVPFGWEWYEMTFFVRWTSSGTSIFCFDLPAHFQEAIRTALLSGPRSTDMSDPYFMFAVIMKELVVVYDNSVWAIRNHICNWEANRHKTLEPDYGLLHEIARHAIHVNETLEVAIKSMKELQAQHGDFIASSAGNSTILRENDKEYQFSTLMLEALLSRSKSNEYRIQNETQLAFHTAAQRDSRTQVQIAEEARKEAIAMKAIAIITMTFLPATFLSSLFSTPFFRADSAADGARHTIILSHQFWIYWILALPLTLLTLIPWIWWNKVWTKRSNAQTKSGHGLNSLELGYM